VTDLIAPKAKNIYCKGPTLALAQMIAVSLTEREATGQTTGTGSTGVKYQGRVKSLINEELMKQGGGMTCLP